MFKDKLLTIRQRESIKINLTPEPALKRMAGGSRISFMDVDLGSNHSLIIVGSK